MHLGIGRKRVAWLTAAVALASLMSSLPAGAGPYPTGTKQLQATTIKRVSGVTCGFLGSKWVPGTKLRGNRFVSHLQQAKNAKLSASRASGSLKATYVAKSRHWTALARKQEQRCRTLARPGSSSPTTVPLVTVPKGGTPAVSLPVSGGGSAAIKVSLRGAVALAVLGSSASTRGVRTMSTSSNLKAVKADGTVFDAITGGTLSVRKVFVAPSDKVYILLNSEVQIDGGPCILFEVGADSEDPRCVERDPTFIRKHSPFHPFPDPIAINVQFDSTGAIYYSGSPRRASIGSPGYFEGWTEQPYVGEYSAQELIVRRWKDGQVADFGYASLPGKSESQPELVDVGVGWQEPSPGSREVSGLQATRSRYVGRWVVTGEGDLIVEQGLGLLNQKLPWDNSTVHAGNRLVVYKSNGAEFVVANNEHSCNYVVNGTWCNEMSLMAEIDEGRISIDCPRYDNTALDPNGICEIDTATWRLGSRRLIENESCAYNNINQIRPRYERMYVYVCFYGGARWLEQWRAPSGAVYALTGGRAICLYSDPNGQCSATWGTQLHLDMNLSGAVVQVSPRYRATTLGGIPGQNVLENVEAVVPILNSAAAAGPEVLSNDGRTPSRFKTVLFDLSTGMTTDLIPVSAGIRVNELAYSPSSRQVLFSGVNIADGKEISGLVDIESKEIKQIGGLEGGVSSIVAVGDGAGAS
jgi:hypothetical protein